jgi:Tfp pilus assembly protein PilV
MRGQRRTKRQRRHTAGLSVIEVVIAISIVSTVLMATAGALVSSIHATHDAQRIGQAAVFLETVMQDLAAQSYEDVTAFNGNHVLDGESITSSSFAADVTVFNASVGLRQVEVVVTDLRTNAIVGRAATLRAKR